MDGRADLWNVLGLVLSAFPCSCHTHTGSAGVPYPNPVSWQGRLGPPQSPLGWVSLHRVYWGCGTDQSHRSGG